MMKDGEKIRIGSVRLALCTAADPIPRFLWNTYANVLRSSGVGKTIGCAIRYGKSRPRNRYWSLVWRGPGR